MAPLDRRNLPRVLGPELLARFAISRKHVRTELRRGTWRRLATGVVLTRPDEATREDWARVGLILAGPGAAVSGWDAVHARGIGERTPPSERVLVLTRTGMNRTVDGVHIRPTSRDYQRRRQPVGAPLELAWIATPPRAVADTALDCVTLGSVRALTGAAVQRRLCTPADLLREYEAGPRGRSALLRAALADLMDGARSAAEATAARRLARGPIPPFELNVPVVDRRGRLIYVVDVLWRALRAGLEIDSREHHFSEEDWLKTLARHNALTRYGLAVTHYAPRSVTCRGSTFVPEVAEWLRGRADELGLPWPARRGVIRPPDGEAPAPFVVRAG